MFDFLNPGGAPAEPGLGGMFNPMADPATQAFLTSTGLNLLAGGWGTRGAQVAHAVGAGMESAAGTAALQEEQRRAEEKMDIQRAELEQRGQLAREEIQGRKDVANIYANQRLQTAGMGGGRGGSALDRQERQVYDRERVRILDKLELGLEDLTPEEVEAGYTVEDAEAVAENRAMQAVLRRRGRFGGGETSPNSPEGAAPVPQPGGTKAPGKTSPNSGPQSAVQPRKMQELPRIPGATGGLMNLANRFRVGPGNTLPAAGGEPLSQFIKRPGVDVPKMLRMKKTVPGRQLLISKGINPDA